nr:DUF6090 family protein [uncultured Psychroserpens sp.]
MSIFNNKRMGLVSKKGLYKYVMYGIGEIVLVVIGILIAVSINNQNQKRASENRLKTYLQVYKQDIEVDTLVLGQAIKFIEDRQEPFKLFLSNTVSEKTYRDNPQGYGLALSYFPLSFQQKGIKLLENYIGETEIEQDTLISDIIASHRIYENLVNTSMERISEDIDNNLNYLKENQPWIADLLLGQLGHPDMMPYLLSDKYRARLTLHSILVYNNLYPQLVQLKKNHIKTIEEIDKRIDDTK